MVEVKAIHAFTDNYIWLLTTNEGSVVIDPGDFRPVSEYIKKHNKDLTGVLITHHHFDHTGGLKDLTKNYEIPIIGPKNNISEINKVVKHGDKVNILGLEFDVIAVPGHTLDHIAFYCENDGEPFLFCGDTLFAGGCGRIFEGTAHQMYDSLQLLKNLPKATKVYCAHEYTEQNLEFALMVEPKNSDLQARYAHVKKLRSENEITVPSNIDVEIKTNPFLRCDEDDIKNLIFEKYDIKGDNPTTFKAVREWKDSF